MLPVYGSGDYDFKSKTGLKEKLHGWIRLIFSEKDSRNLFLFLCLNLSFAFVELFYGMWTNSLGLISDAFHMFFDCSALLTGLAASLVAKWKANERYTYGYVRAEILGGFVNALLLVFVAFFIFSEAVERMAEPPLVKHDRLFLVSVLGFFVNILGIVVFNHGGQHHGHSHGGGSHGHSHGGSSDTHSHSHNNFQNKESHIVIDALEDGFCHHSHSHNHNHGHSHEGKSECAEEGHNRILQGVFLHILADTLGSVGVIISSYLIKNYDLMIADPICSLCISVLIAISVLPLLKDSIGILMMRTPKEIEHQLYGCYQKVQSIQGVCSIQDPHFWTLCSDVYVGSIKLEVLSHVDIKQIQTHVQAIFYHIGVKDLYIQIDLISS